MQFSFKRMDFHGILEVTFVILCTLYSDSKPNYSQSLSHPLIFPPKIAQSTGKFNQVIRYGHTEEAILNKTKFNLKPKNK